MNEIVVVPTYRRNEYLWCCLRRIRCQDADIEIVVFSDRDQDTGELRDACRTFDAGLRVLPVHDYYGNSYCVMEALRFVYENYVADLIHVCEDDFMQGEDCLAWHRRIHQMPVDIFCSCGWVFNRQAPIADSLLFAPWYYAPNASIKREKLAQVVRHANPLYYNAMREYVLRTFPDSLLHSKGAQENTGFWEQDAVFQYCIEADGSQVAWNGIAKGCHVGASGYNRPSGPKFFGTLEERIAQVEDLIEDHHWRAELFSREVVEREIGHALARRAFRYEVTLPGGWRSEFTSELTQRRLPKRLNSVDLPEGARISLL